MKKAAWVLLALFACALAGAAGEARFMRYPTVSGGRIVFTYEGDLWSVAAGGGTAARLTTHPGVETMARFSPDGKLIAFTAGYDGPQAVYVVPAEGGEPKRLTYTPSSAQVVGWAPDGSRVVYRSMFENVVGRDPNLYFVGLEGTVPERFPLDRGVLCSFSPDGRRMLYCRRGNEEYYWKRYKGGQYQDIWMYDWAAKKSTPVTDYVGKNSYPMWIGDTMVFVSDRGNGIANLYAQKIGTRDVRPLTSYPDFDVMMPSTDGVSIVYVQDGRLHLIDPASGRDGVLTVTLPSDRWPLRPRTINPKDYIHAVDVANDGTTVVLEARGDLFTVPTGKGAARNLSNTAGTREMHPAVSPDGRTIAFFSDRTGDYQLYTQSVSGGAWTALTTGLDRLVYHLAWSPDGGKILFGNKEFAVFYVDVATKKLVKVDASNQMKNDEFFWEVSDYGWSPDGNWICYSLVQDNRNSRIFLYSLADGKKFPVTDDFYDNINPCFDAGGDYLYYLSSRNFDVQMDFYEDNHVLSAPQQVMAVQLRAGEAPPFGDAAAPAEAGKAPAKEAPRPFRIDIEGLAQRTFPLPGEPGNFFFLRAGRGMAAWCSVDRFTDDEYEEIFKPRGRTKWTLRIFDAAAKRTAVLGDKVREFGLSANGERIFIRKDNDIYVTTPAEAFKTKAIGEKLDLQGLTYVVDPRAEWEQIFTDAWRWYRDFFYDADFHGRDWQAMGEKYRAYLPALSSRDELNWVLSQMVGELCVSHTYVGGGDPGPQTMPPSSLVFTGLLGADIVADKASGLYRFERIYGPNAINLDLKGPLVGPDKDVRAGDYLIAVNGNAVRPPQDYFRLLQTTPGRKISITVNAKPTAAGAKTFEVEPLRSDQPLRYFAWLADNVSKVLEASGGRVGYMHINAMGSGGIAEFDKFWRAFRYKEGLILDVRRNSGGWTEYFLIDKLERVLVAFNVLRGMVPFRYPGSAGNGNYVVVSNENNGSDGEAFVEHFKARKLGTVVGVPSWGGLVGILNRQLTIDNGSVEQSNNAFFGRGGTWLVENHGADPDILVDNDPDSAAAGRDLQLEKAIEVMMERIKANPFTFPDRPAYPKK